MPKLEQDFDWQFYLSVYPDLREAGINTEEQAFSHWQAYGKRERRIHNRVAMEKRYVLLLANSRRVELGQGILARPQQLINVLIRTSRRPDHFRKCISSVLGQQYSNVRIIVCYDDESCLSYLEQYPTIDKFFVNIESEEKYKFNLYCNDLMDKVKEGWIMFLDDDDMLVHPHVLSIINCGLLDEETFLIWKFLRPDQAIFHKDIDDIRLGEIDTSSFCFHSSHKEAARWGDQQYGDWRFVTELLKSHAFTRRAIPRILTATSYCDKIGSFGEVGEL